MALQQSMTPSTLLESIVTIPSISADEAAAVACLQDAARSMGFQIVEDEVGNFIAELGTGPELWFVGHVDTVAGEIPVRIDDGVLHGRGTVDAKGPLVAALFAAHAARDCGFTLRVIGCVGEEDDSRGAKNLVSGEPPAAMINLEPSGFDGVTIAYRGIVRAKISMRQPRVHGGHPELGPVEKFMTAWQQLNDELGAANDGGFASFQTRIRAIQGGHEGAQDILDAEVEIRIPPNHDAAEVVAKLTDYFPETEICEAWNPVQTNPRHPLVNAFRASIRDAGHTPRIKQKTGTSDWNVLATTWPDVPTVAYGPGDSHLDHGPDEHIVLAQLDSAVSIIVDAISTYRTFVAH